MAAYRFGKHPPIIDYRTLRFQTYLTAGVPAPPPADDVLARVYANLKVSDPTALFPMDGNDTLGDCTIAALAHAKTVYHGLLGNSQIMAQADVVALYEHLTGGQDTGLDELKVLKYWRSHAVAGDKILAYVSIDPKNHAHVQQAVALFGGVYLGFQVQQNCIQQFNAHEPWTPAPLTQDGHAVYAVGYDQTGVTVLTWGSTQQATWAWWDECVDEAFAILPPEAQNPGYAPGFDFAQLKADLASVTN